MTMGKTLVCTFVAVFLALAAGLAASSAQGPATFNEREVKSSGTTSDDPKSDVWTFDFRFKDPRLIVKNVPGRGTRICWYLWYQVINRSKEPQKFYPFFELAPPDFPGPYLDEPLTTVEEAIKKSEDPSGNQENKNSVKFCVT